MNSRTGEFAALGFTGALLGAAFVAPVVGLTPLGFVTMTAFGAAMGALWGALSKEEEK